MSLSGRWLVAERRTITRRLIRYLVKEFRGLSSYHVPDAQRFSATVVPMVHGAQISLAEAVSASFADQAGEFHDRPVPPPPIPREKVIDLRNGVTTEEVYRRPFSEVWKALKQQELETEDRLQKAVDLGVNRLEAIADEDLQLTYANATREAMQNTRAASRPLWWRRVPQGRYTCALCMVASTRAYRTGELNPIHPACDCTVEPMFTPRPNGVTDEKLLERVHRAVEKELGIREYSGRGQVDYRDLLIEMIDEHGELGRVLVRPRKRNPNNPRIRR